MTKFFIIIIRIFVVIIIITFTFVIVFFLFIIIIRIFVVIIIITFTFVIVFFLINLYVSFIFIIRYFSSLLLEFFTTSLSTSFNKLSSKMQSSSEPSVFVEISQLLKDLWIKSSSTSSYDSLIQV